MYELGKIINLRSGTYVYHIIAVSVDPLGKCVWKIRGCSQGKQGKKQGMSWEKS